MLCQDIVKKKRMPHYTNISPRKKAARERQRYLNKKGFAKKKQCTTSYIDSKIINASERQNCYQKASDSTNYVQNKKTAKEDNKSPDKNTNPLSIQSKAGQRISDKAAYNHPCNDLSLKDNVNQTNPEATFTQLSSINRITQPIQAKDEYDLSSKDNLDQTTQDASTTQLFSTNRADRHFLAKDSYNLPLSGNVDQTNHNASFMQLSGIYKTNQSIKDKDSYNILLNNNLDQTYHDASFTQQKSITKEAPKQKNRKRRTPGTKTILLEKISVSQTTQNVSEQNQKKKHDNGFDNQEIYSGKYVCISCQSVLCGKGLKRSEQNEYQKPILQNQELPDEHHLFTTNNMYICVTCANLMQNMNDDDAPNYLDELNHSTASKDLQSENAIEKNNQSDTIYQWSSDNEDSQLFKGGVCSQMLSNIRVGQYSHVTTGIQLSSMHTNEQYYRDTSFKMNMKTTDDENDPQDVSLKSLIQTRSRQTLHQTATTQQPPKNENYQHAHHNTGVFQNNQANAPRHLSNTEHAASNSSKNKETGKYLCIACHRDLKRTTVKRFIPKRYQQIKIRDQFFQDFDLSTGNNTSSYICRTCDKDIMQNKIPKACIAQLRCTTAYIDDVINSALNKQHCSENASDPSYNVMCKKNAKLDKATLQNSNSQLSLETTTEQSILDMSSCEFPSQGDFEQNILKASFKQLSTINETSQSINEKGAHDLSSEDNLDQTSQDASTTQLSAKHRTDQSMQDKDSYSLSLSNNLDQTYSDASLTKHALITTETSKQKTIKRRPKATKNLLSEKRDVSRTNHMKVPTKSKRKRHENALDNKGIDARKYVCISCQTVLCGPRSKRSRQNEYQKTTQRDQEFPEEHQFLKTNNSMYICFTCENFMQNIVDLDDDVPNYLDGLNHDTASKELQSENAIDKINQSDTIYQLSSDNENSQFFKGDVRSQMSSNIKVVQDSHLTAVNQLSSITNEQSYQNKSFQMELGKTDETNDQQDASFQLLTETRPGQTFHGITTTQLPPKNRNDKDNQNNAHEFQNNKEDEPRHLNKTGHTASNNCKNKKTGTYLCIACQRDRSRGTVRRFIPKRYQQSKIRDQVFQDFDHLIGNKTSFYICQTCDKDIMQNQMPRACKAKLAKIDQAALRFQEAIKEKANYVCISCHRMLYKKTVKAYKASNYVEVKDDIRNKVLHEKYRLTSANGQQWICSTCHRHIKQNKIPPQSKANNMSLGKVPPELAELTPLELRLISLRIPFMRLISLPKGKQKSIHGPAVNIPASLTPINTLLPRLPKQAHLIPLKLKRKLKYKQAYMNNFIRPSKIQNALTYLKAKNSLYKDININQTWQTQWREEDPDLWDAINQNPEQIMQELESDMHDNNLPPVNAAPTDELRSTCSLSFDNNTDISTDDEAPDEDPSSTLANMSKCMTQTDELLDNISKEDLIATAAFRGYTIQDVPADGSCMFHSVSAQLSQHGIAVTTNSLRTQVIRYLQQHRHRYENFICTHINHHQDTAPRDKLDDLVEDVRLHNLDLAQNLLWDRYIHNLESGSWGDDVCLQAIADKFHVNINILQPHPTSLNGQVTIKTAQVMTDNNNLSLPTVWLGFIPQRHYVIMRPAAKYRKRLTCKRPNKSTTDKQESKSPPPELQQMKAHECKIQDPKKGYPGMATSVEQENDCILNQACYTSKSKVLDKRERSNTITTSNDNTKPNEEDVLQQEDQAEFERTVKLTGLPYDTCLQHETTAGADEIFSVAPGEGNKPHIDSIRSIFRRNVQPRQISRWETWSDRSNTSSTNNTG